MINSVQETCPKIGAPFCFERIGAGHCLFLGEGNMSFSRAIAMKNLARTNQITATTFERFGELGAETKKIASSLRALGCNVKHGVDATSIAASPGLVTFDRIIFQFPHGGSRIPIYGRTANSVLAKRFLQSSLNHLRPNGRVIMTIVDNSFYEGSFNIPAAIAFSGLRIASIHRFFPDQFDGYRHQMSHQNADGLKRHRKFKSMVLVK